jgi:2-oxoglutarate dehydrogenase E2 component (dihydrolipoamide succinyltransferase)
MPIEFTVPEVGESISEVQIGEWLKKEGDYVQRNEEVVVIETDKATVELPAPESGRVTRILKKNGETASVHEVIGYIDTGDAQEAAKARPAEKPAPTREEEISEKAPKEERADTNEANKKRAAQNGEKAAGGPERGKAVKEEPSKIFEKKPAVEEETQEETQPEEIRKPLRLYPVGRDAQPAAADVTGGRETTEPGPPGELREPPRGREEEAVLMTQLRRRIAERLVQAQQSAALLTTFNEIDMSAVIELREKYRETFSKKYQIKLGFMSFFVKAAIEALKLIPEVNAEIRDGSIVYHRYFDIGVAVGGGKGLVVPVLRNAERLTFAEIEQAIHDFARRAEEGKLKPGELQGGTFTISNGGIYGSLLSTPIVNPPQSGILGLHAIQERPVVRQQAVVIRPMMYVALTYDHRIIDGREAVTFLKQIKNLIEDPARILLEV